MTTWAWRGRNHRGELIQGVIDADDDDAVAQQLLAGGVTPVEIKVAVRAVEAPAAGWWAALRTAPLQLLDLLLLSRQMYTLQRAGVPILRALAGLQASSSKPAMVALLADLRASLDQGRELATAMARHPRVFDPFYIAMVRVGEMTGRLTESFKQLAEHIEFDLDVRARVRQALRYPMLVVGAIVIAMFVINLFVIPTFANVFASFKAQLPLMTRILLALSAFTVRWWPLLLALAVSTGWGVRTWIATPAGRYTWDRWKLRLPIAGPIVLKATLARFARSFALASRSGVPISSAMTVVSQTVDNAFVGQRIEQMRDGIERGESLSRCAAATGVFTPIVLQMIAVGEETGELDTLLDEIAEMYERETDYAIKGLSSSIEPVLLTIIGAMVLVLALGVFLPLWNLGQAASGRG
ncbi:MSHA biogenesis protein MshG [Rubrivivax sp. A210]|uniref:type II secretion system F family protein n=1 Tax=Rubrivivax sp. A210 TaxID=2772301 RepID=UPI00191B629D|nr:type II secretion system F family protein [Rubrivivax sp. A210]CAD5370271.1 MSHA biogenesis protein MshG [Rubrivivax sp. A210]